MATGLDKYRAQFFQILGFIFLTPLGKFIMRFLDVDNPFPFTLKSVFVFVISILIGYYGIIFVLKGDEYSEGGK